MPRRARLLIPCGLLLALALAGCGNDSTGPGTKPFLLELSIQDPAGHPVSGLEARLHVPIPGFPVAAAKSVTALQFTIAEDAHVNLGVYDLEGRLARTVWDAELPAGVHQILVAGGHGEDFLMGSRTYRYELVASVDGVETFRDSKYMSVYTSPDIEQQPVLGSSDEHGVIRFTDKTHFPFLYDLGPQPMVDENGETVGTFEFGDVVIIRLHDPVSGLHMNHEVSIDAGRNALTLVWDVEKAGRDADGPLAAPTAVAHAGANAPATPIIPVPEYRLSQNRPNPFN